MPLWCESRGWDRARTPGLSQLRGYSLPCDLMEKAIKLREAGQGQVFVWGQVGIDQRVVRLCFVSGVTGGEYWQLGVVQWVVNNCTVDIYTYCFHHFFVSVFLFFVIVYLNQQVLLCFQFYPLSDLEGNKWLPVRLNLNRNTL